MLDFIFSKKKNNTDETINLLFNKLILNQISREEIEENSAYTRYEILDRPVQAAVINFTGMCDVISHACEPFEWLEKYFKNVVSTEEGVIFYDTANRAVMVFFLDVLWEEQVIAILDDIRKEALNKAIGELPLITVGEMVEDCMQLHISYGHAVRIQAYSLIKPKGKIIYYYDIVARKSSYPSFIDISYLYMYQLVESSNLQEIESYIDRAFTELSDQRKYNMGLVYNITFEIIINAYSAARQAGRNVLDVASPEDNISTQVLSHTDIQALKKWLIELMRKLM